MYFNNTHIKKIQDVCKKHRVDKLFAFGSVLTKNFTEKSDIDILVSFSEMDLYGYFDNYLSLKAELEKLFERPIDLVEEQTLKNPILIQNIHKNKKLLYERESFEMAV